MIKIKKKYEYLIVFLIVIWTSTLWKGIRIDYFVVYCIWISIFITLIYSLIEILLVKKMKNNCIKNKYIVKAYESYLKKISEYNLWQIWSFISEIEDQNATKIQEIFLKNYNYNNFKNSNKLFKNKYKNPRYYYFISIVKLSDKILDLNSQKKYNYDIENINIKFSKIKNIKKAIEHGKLNLTIIENYDNHDYEKVFYIIHDNNFTEWLYIELIYMYICAKKCGIQFEETLSDEQKKRLHSALEMEEYKNFVERELAA